MTFNTIEDINGTQFDNQGFWWYELDTALIDPTGNAEFSNVKLDFLTISKEKVDTYKYKFTVKVDNSLWTGGAYIFNQREMPNVPAIQFTDDGFTVILSRGAIDFPAKIVLYMGITELYNVKERMRYYFGNNSVMDLQLNDLANKRVFVRMWGDISIYGVTLSLTKGFNEVRYKNTFAGFILVNILKTDFQFTCNQDLIVGEVNTVRLGTHSDYKPNGALVEGETKLSVLYNNKTIPVIWNSQLNDYTFDLDLTNVTEEKKIRFKVIVETNDVLNHSETDVVLNANFETIDTLEKLTNLFKIGGTGRLSEVIQLTTDLTLSKSVNLIGNDCSIDMTSHKLVIPSDLTFKAESVCFQQGVNTIQQEPNSTVELNDCSFTGCTGFGSVIDCQVDLASLDDSDDFNTKLTNCNIVNCDMAILSGGNLEVDGCNVNGKISNKNYPYFLYQTDGNATILNSEFNLTDETVYDYDIEFNSCIFTCGETATINGYSHTELQQNNITAFFDTQRNTSTIDVKYYYSLIEDTVHLQSLKGYCHSVSGVDYIFKSNVTITRGE